MRKESTYYPFAVSPSDARGLLQLIPSTSSEVAKQLGLTTFADELFDPDSAHAMIRWCDQWAGRPLDELVELVTYDQAREYIKRVLGIYARYRHLYGQPLELSLTVSTQYLKDGFDF